VHIFEEEKRKEKFESAPLLAKLGDFSGQEQLVYFNFGGNIRPMLILYESSANTTFGVNFADSQNKSLYNN
jgi:hypothetical protein